MATAEHPIVAQTALPPSSDADPFGSAILENPDEFHAELRDAGPVVHLRRYDVYAMARYDQVHAALTDWQSFESGAGVGYSNFRTEKPWRPPSLLLETDPPVHDAPREVLSSILSMRAIRRLSEYWKADATAFVESLPASTAVDAARDVAAQFPLRVFPDAVGIGENGRENLLPYGDHLFNAFGPHNDLVARGEPTIPAIAQWVNQQCARENLAQTVYGDQPTFGAEVWKAADRGDITAEQAPTIVRSLLSAGVDTTVHGLGAVLHALATNPEQWAQLRTHPGLARIAFDEAVRAEAPVQTFFRTATRDIRVDDVIIPAGKKILMFLGAANRDPRRWDNPDKFDLSRNPSGHVGFGMGIHQCVGQHVARLEAESLLRALARRFRRIDIAGIPIRHHNNTMRAWESLPVELVE
ncbi:cytochrome P450 [Tsukamurella tyrosinosolvens]|uniref:cytochrome P450 n=1 Tax=Tsukamurella tyrosinosolvens TaxID=57704 RepID=UPI001CE128C3|nr:cytochrome P450 [Tsukamurella tyrosinosolvens]MCA4997890.1 cytochrome P450 [Tsukamurella tyrosinosolvens]